MAVLSSSPGSRSRSAPPTETRVLAAAAVGCLALAVLLSPATASDGPVLCPFRLLTGLPCPGCGMTRAWVFAMHGRYGDALAANPFVLIAMPAAAVFVVAVGLCWYRGRPPPDLGRVVRHPLAKVIVAGWLAFAVVRLVAVATGHATV